MSESDFARNLEEIRTFIAFPRISPNDVNNVCNAFLQRIGGITNLFTMLVSNPDEFETMSHCIRKLFESAYSDVLFKDKNVQKWLIAGIKQQEYSELNTLSMDCLYFCIKNEDNLNYWVNHGTFYVFFFVFFLFFAPKKETIATQFRSIVLRNFAIYFFLFFLV